MAHLLLLASASDTPVAFIGGAPTAGGDVPWPVCKSCKGNMQFIAQAPLSLAEIAGFDGGGKALLVFQCQNDPGMCDDWDANGGGNRALVVPERSGAMVVPASGAVRADGQSPAVAVAYDETVGNDTPDDNYNAAMGANGGQLLGKTGAVPLWQQGDETPACSCGAKMSFVLQLEEAGGGGLNFGGGGAGYAFVCAACSGQAKFLFQC